MSKDGTTPIAQLDRCIQGLIARVEHLERENAEADRRFRELTQRLTDHMQREHDLTIY